MIGALAANFAGSRVPILVPLSQATFGTQRRQVGGYGQETKSEFPQKFGL
jgi:hypothetical protein